MIAIESDGWMISTIIAHLHQSPNTNYSFLLLALSLTLLFVDREDGTNSTPFSIAMSHNPTTNATFEELENDKSQDGHGDASAQTPPAKEKPAIRHAEKRRTSTCRFADRVAQLSVDHYKANIPVEQRPPQTCIATILAHYRGNENSHVDDNKNRGMLWILSMGVGTKFLSELSLQQEVETENQVGYGSRVRDMHAEVLARRAFRRQLTLEIQEDLRKLEEEEGDCEPNTGPRSGSSMSVLVRSQAENSTTIRYALRRGVTLHMYTSSAPCGNATLKKFCKMSKERFRDDLGPDEWPDAPHEPPPGHSIKLGEFSLLVKKNNANSTIENNNEVDANSLSDCNKRKNEEKSSNDVAGSQKADPSAADPVKTKKRARNQQEEPSSNKPSQKTAQRRGKPWPATLSDDWAPPGTTIVRFPHKGSLHTCSDKICRWNYLGLQGSLLAGILEEPLYLSTLTVGRKLSGAPCRRAICCRLDTRCRQPRLSEIDNNREASKYRVNHPAVMGTSVYLSDGIVDTSNIEGQDVRFHSSVVWTWWKGQSDSTNISNMDTGNCFDGIMECIESSSGLLAPSTEDNDQADTGQIHRAAPKVSTKELISLFLQVYHRAASSKNPSSNSSGCETGESDGDDTMGRNLSFDNTLSGIREIKKQCSPMHESFKDLLLTEHKVLSQWRRRVDLGTCSHCPGSR